MESEVFLTSSDAGEMSPGNDEKNLRGESNPWPEMAAELEKGKPAGKLPEIGKETRGCMFDGIELESVENIDISSNEGKCKWLADTLENNELIAEYGLKDAESHGDNDRISYERSRLNFLKRQRAILEEMRRGVIMAENDDIINSLRRKRHDLYDKLNEVLESGNATQKDIDETFENYSATFNLSGLLESETARRDPKYFSSDGMRGILISKVRQAERGVDETMFNGHLDENGLARTAEDGERLPSVATENAQIILEEARQDAEVFDSLIGVYNAAHNYQVPHAIKKKDFRPTIEGHIEGHRTQISRLITELSYLTKGTSEYLEKEAEIKKQRQHRNAAIRLATTYF